MLGTLYFFSLGGHTLGNSLQVGETGCWTETSDFPFFIGQIMGELLAYLQYSTNLLNDCVVLILFRQKVLCKKG